jgi:hypothetical protein
MILYPIARGLSALAIVASSLLSGLLGFAQEQNPAQPLRMEREIQATSITSLHDPALVIKLPTSARYVGGTRVVLFNTSDCEAHVFVEAGARKVVQRLYWIQFEGYLPSKPSLHHTYPFTETAKIAGIDFDVKARFGSSDEKPQSGSDLEQVRSLLAAGGYILPDNMMNVRLVHMLDKEKRKEFMMIYSEDLRPTGFTARDLMPGGKGEDHWPAIKKGLIGRAQKKIALKNIPQP